MYDRAPRVLDLPGGSTEANVGPGSYDLPSVTLSRRPGGYAPFLSLTDRDFAFDAQSLVAVPGPGHYDVATVQNTVKGGQTLQNTEVRFKETRSANPGPGTYDLDLDSVNPCHSGCGFKHRKQLRSVSQVQYQRKPEAPSIPTTAQAYGYEEKADGSLVQQLPPARDKSLGPAFYQPVFNEAYATSRYKGVHFGNLTAKRLEYKSHEGPGPGEYHITQESTVHYENVNLKKEDKKKYDPFIPRYHEVIALREEKKGVPGPGKYDLVSQFEKNKYTPSSADAPRAPFLSLSKRFVPMKSFTPAPGAYNEVRTAFENLKKSSGMALVPFGQTAVRFIQDSRMAKTPGPGAYNIFAFGVARESLKKAYQESCQKGAFGSSAVRTMAVSQSEAVWSPGPADYQVKEKLEEPYKQKKTSVFSSQTRRMKAIQPPNEAPPPGSYDVCESFEKSQGKRQYRPPRTTQAKRKHNSFLVAAPRGLNLAADASIPGPGTYDPLVQSSAKALLTVPRDERFKEQKVTTPGPGAYELSPMYKDTVLKKTFNATLSNPVQYQMDTLPKDPIPQKACSLSV
ncbi:sperm-tail PG-rich repeat-containing protein 2 [Ambystoma mexicanum]|uniref:sperm-tail PG-rich repeat-containing protein 2 n=1 Tax=Ambystoma mexicanum TaxID=8296 RepID=UPI0037E71307